jgi:hypothetical protein
MTVLVCVSTSKQVGDPEHLKVFATTDAAENWFEENDPEGVAFEYEVLEWKRPPTEAALLAFSFRFSEGGFYLPLILVDSLYGFEDRHLAVASFANAFASC